MAFPENCFTDLIAIPGTCEPQTAVYQINDIPGMTLDALAQLAESDNPSGETTGIKLIEAAARLLIADVVAIYDGSYKVESTLVSGCSTCNFLTSYLQGTQRGVVIKDLTESSFSRMLIDRLEAKMNASGTFNIVIDDGNASNLRIIPWEAEAGVEFEFQGIKYITKSKRVRIYTQEDNAPLAQLSCKTGSAGCGCTGRRDTISDLVYTGTLNGADTQQAYGFKPCAQIICNPDDLLCFMAHSAPRMIGMALLYKTAELFFTQKVQSTRNNKVAGLHADTTQEDVKKYAGLYQDKLVGRGTRGLKDLVFSTLQKTTDICVVCNSLTGIGWVGG